MIPDRLRVALRLGHGPRYRLVGEADDESQETAAKPASWCHLLAYPLSAVGLLLVLGILWQADLATPPKTCRRPVVRREWRSLSGEERDDFTRAVNCLSRVPSRWGRNGTVYDDFTALHGGIGSWCHRSASFLPWHRYTLFVWESALREHCGFEGHVPYWDWTADWMGLANSSIWDPAAGFGGDGDPRGPVTVGGGRCVVDGPFRGLRPAMYNHTYVRHCLSRGFRDGDTAGALPGGAFSPGAVGRIMRRPTYGEFVREVEYRLHNTMHTAVAGDFLALTAANDPIFFVHHAQLDHLWWRWQQEDPARRLREYQGRHMYNSTDENASLSDVLLYGGFAKDIPVSGVMDTTNGLLCYRY